MDAKWKYAHEPLFRSMIGAVDMTHKRLIQLCASANASDICQPLPVYTDRGISTISDCFAMLSTIQAPCLSNGHRMLYEMCFETVGKLSVCVRSSYMAFKNAFYSGRDINDTITQFSVQVFALIREMIKNADTAK